MQSLYCIAFVSWFWSSACCPGFLRFPVPWTLSLFRLFGLDYPLINLCVWILNFVF